MKSLTFVEIDVPGFANPGQTQTFRFAQDSGYLPPEFDAIPSLQGVNPQPATLSLGKDLGQRASITATFADHKHIFNGEPFNQGSFWGKFRGRHGAKLRGRPFRLVRGVLGQSFAEMDVRHYIIETTDGPTPGGVYAIEAKDVLKLADNERAQAPLLSNGSLAGSISDTATTAFLSPAGIGDAEYPASGWVCFGGKEVAAFTRVADTLTLTRAQLGSVARSHTAGDRAQLVLRYAGNDVATIIADLLTTYAGVDPSYIPLATWQAETAAQLAVLYAATLTEPTSVRKLLSELIEQAALAVWWDDQARLIRLQVLREIATDAATFDEETIVEGSLQVKEQPDTRISQIWTYYGQRDPTDQADESDNYRAALATVDLGLEAEYGLPSIRKITGRWVPTISAAQRLNGIQMSRFRDPPRAFSFALFRDQQVDLAGGYQLKWRFNQDQNGLVIPAKIQIKRVRHEADYLYIEAEEMLASGVIVLTHTVLLTTAAGLQNWVVPETWNNADNSIETIGASGAGAGNPPTQAGGKGGGGGAYSGITNLSLTPLSSVPYQAGAAGAAAGGAAGGNGGDTWFNGASLGTSSVGAKGGVGGNGRSGGGAGGQAAAGVGTIRTSGGNGGDGGAHDGNRGGGGGGGAAGGPHGNGANGGNVPTDQTNAAGGGGADGGANGANGNAGGNGGNNRFGFGGGTSDLPTGQQGGGGHGNGPGGPGEQLWTQTVAPIIAAGPGGGGGGGAIMNQGAPGGQYGGGGGGCGGSGGAGGPGTQGIIAISWREAA